MSCSHRYGLGFIPDVQDFSPWRSSHHYSRMATWQAYVETEKESSTSAEELARRSVACLLRTRVLAILQTVPFPTME